MLLAQIVILNAQLGIKTEHVKSHIHDDIDDRIDSKVFPERSKVNLFSYINLMQHYSSFRLISTSRCRRAWRTIDCDLFTLHLRGMK